MKYQFYNIENQCGNHFDMDLQMQVMLCQDLFLRQDI